MNAWAIFLCGVTVGALIESVVWIVILATEDRREERIREIMDEELRRRDR